MNVYRVDGKTGAVTVVADEHQCAERAGVFAGREKTLHRGIAQRAAPHSESLTSTGDKIANGKVLIDSGPQGTPDGFRCDIDGNLWCGWGMTPELDGVRVFTPQGEPIGHISLPERCANVCFGGVKRNRLFMAAAHSLYALYVNAQGAPGG